MARPRIDRQKVWELSDAGVKGVEIARKMKCSSAAVCKILKEAKYITRAAAVAAPQYERKKDKATSHLLWLCERAQKEIDWIESEVPRKGDKDYRHWLDQKLKFSAEMRKLIGSIADIGYKLFQVEEINEILRIIDEEIGKEDEDCQKRIRERIQRRRNIRFAPAEHKQQAG